MKTLLLATALVALASPSAMAQERGRFGLAMGAPASITAVWNVGPRLAVLPKISFSGGETETSSESQLIINGVVVATSRISTLSEGWLAAPGFDVRVYVTSWDNLRAYVAPGYGYVRSSTTITTSTTSPFATVPSESRDLTTSGHDIRAVLGAEFTPHRRFGLYGEVGIRRATSAPRLPGSLSTTTSTRSSNIGSTSAVGAIFYF